ncbi:MAG: translational GTPase TypA [Tissierellia bacterium]|nr:translational GTPase TypA [Tissierellia bacterium]
MQRRKDIRNIAIIAHVDHGKTTLVDSLLKESGVFRKNQVVEDRVMDSNDIERERGITILSKNTAIHYGDVKINIVDTPGHADFGGEVERVLKMVEGVVLVVDAFEGPMPQTKFVLKNALDLNLPVIVLVNKIDREDARPEEVIDEVLDLFIELGADSYIDSPFVFSSAKKGYASDDYKIETSNMYSLFDKIVEYIPGPIYDIDSPFRVLISTIDYNEYVGRIGIGKIESGTIEENTDAVLKNYNHPDLEKNVKISKLYEFEGLKREEVDSSDVGSIIAISGIADINIGDTLCSPLDPTPLPFVKISEPTIAMNFSVNDSPFAGREGKFLTSRQIRTRLFRELQTDVSLRVEETDSTDTFKVSGRGELHLSVLIENMRREGFEFQVSKPVVLYKTIEGVLMEPMETAIISVSKDYIGPVIEKLGSRRGELISMSEPQGGYTKLEFSIPARGLIGYRQEFMTDTKGEGIINTIFDSYQPVKGEIPRRTTGSLISFEMGVSTPYGLNSAEERGILFIGPNTDVYQGMVIGENPKGLDIDINVCRKKKETNIRAAGSDDAIKLSPARILSLEEALEFIEDDELIEITPKNLRIRKKYLDPNKRYKARK